MLPPADLARALAPLDADVVCLQEVDVDQPRSHRVHQAALAAEALGAPEWAFAPTLAGTPSPWRTWHPLLPTVTTSDASPTSQEASRRGEGVRSRGTYGVAVVSRVPVRSWRVLGLGGSAASLPMRVPDPRTGQPRWWWVPDEPRVALAADLDDATVVTTHLSFSPVPAVRQLRRVRKWAVAAQRPVVVAGDLNLPAAVVGALLGVPGLDREPTYPAPAPRLRLDHVVALDGPAAHTSVQRLDVGDHRAVVATLAV